MEKARLVEVAQAWQVYSSHTSNILGLASPTPRIPHKTLFLKNQDLTKSLKTLCEQGLASLVTGYFMDHLERIFKQEIRPKFWLHFKEFSSFKNKQKTTEQFNSWVHMTLSTALAEICNVKSGHEECLMSLIHMLEASARSNAAGLSSNGGALPANVQAPYLFSLYQTTVTALLLTSAPKCFPELLQAYFKARLEEFNRAVQRRVQKGSGLQEGDYQINSEEDDDMGSSSGSKQASEDMDINDNGRESIHQMLGIEDGSLDAGLHYSSVSDYKLGSSTAVHEVVEVAGESWVSDVGNVVRHLRELGFAAMCEEAYAAAILSLLKSKILYVADKRYDTAVLAPIRQWIEAVPMRFLCVILASSGAPTNFTGISISPSPLASMPSLPESCTAVSKERIVRWRLRLQFFAYETLGDLRINELFDIIVDYPESLAAIEDLKECLANTGHHAKLVESFRTALRQRLLTAGAATTDILMQYVSTIKALRTMDPTGVVLEAVGEPIREYLRGRKDTIRCIVTMLTDDPSTGGGGGLGTVGESLLEELSRGATALENADSDDEVDIDGEEAWAAAQRWEPDPVEADPSRTSKSRRSMDIISMLVGIYGSKELFVNEYRVMLAEKLLNKSDYDTDRDIRTLELLKLRFGESNMHGCEIMLKDVADSKRINSNIKAALAAGTTASAATSTPSLTPIPAETTNQEMQITSPQPEENQDQLSLEIIDATILSALFWPPFQSETIKVPDIVNNLLEDYARRYHAIKAPRKLQWKTHLGTVKLELQFEDRTAQFVVSPLHASIILLFEKQPRWSGTDLAAAVGVPVTTLRRRIMLWVNQGVLLESRAAGEEEIYYEVVESMGESAKHSLGATQSAGDLAVPLLEEEEGESAVASMEEQWQQEMNIYESYVVGMLTNFESLPLDRIHNMLKMFVSDPPYDKTLQQLQGFLARLIADEKLEIRDGLYRRKQQ